MVLAVADQGRRVLAELAVGYDPRDGRKRASVHGHGEPGERLDILELIVTAHRVEEGQGVPDPRCADPLWPGRAEHGVVRAVGLRPVGHVVGPADMVLV